MLTFCTEKKATIVIFFFFSILFSQSVQFWGFSPGSHRCVFLRACLQSVERSRICSFISPTRGMTVLIGQLSFSHVLCLYFGKVKLAGGQFWKVSKTHSYAWIVLKRSAQSVKIRPCETGAGGVGTYLSPPLRLARSVF